VMAPQTKPSCLSRTARLPAAAHRNGDRLPRLRQRWRFQAAWAARRRLCLEHLHKAREKRPLERISFALPAGAASGWSAR
jgi:hypothetical protein